MKVLCVIDHFGGGGAQRQMVELACGLKHRGHVVEMFIYFPQYTFFRSRITTCDIPVHEYRKGRGFSWGVVKALSSLMRTGSYDVVLSYLDSPSVYAEICRFVAPAPKLVVSERNSHHADRSRLGAYVRRSFHRVADRVVVNSQSHERWLKSTFHWMQGKAAVIYNGLDIEEYACEPPAPPRSRELRLLSIGRVGPQKNTVNLVKACEVFYRTQGWVPRISWAGRRDTSRRGQRYWREVDELLTGCPEVKNHWRWLGERSDVPALLQDHHALIHPSVYEGLPNVVCEALAAGRPVLASHVCDHPELVVDGERGFLFDPLSPDSIANSIGKLAALTAGDWARLSRNARAYAESVLTADRMISEYETLLSGLAGCAPALVP